ncbi:hypothetical protein ACJZ2D_015837 [Fusarium nematophilum]
MSNPEKTPQYSAPGEQHGGGLLPTADPGQQFPPPPPGPPPPQESAPPAYEQGTAELPGDEKRPIPVAAQQTQPSGSEKQQVPYFPPPPAPQPQDQVPLGTQGAKDEKAQDFPPPPPGPPPAQQEQKSAPHPNPLEANPVAPQPTQQNYSIPGYDPAHPVFAPPPTNEPAKPDVTAAAPAPAPAAVPGTASTSAPVEEHKKHGWSEKFSQLGIKAAAPINSLVHKLGSQSFLPDTLDKECEKAASILRTFCKKGVYADPASSQVPTSTDPKATETNDSIIDPTKQKPKNRVIVTIPPKVISKAVGLAIFTTLRAGFNVSGATGSGILIARLPDGSWGPPSGIQVHSVGGGFLVGLDIYDCVCVINSREALAAFTNTRVGLGSDLAVVAGPYGAGGAVEFGTAMENRDGRKSKEPKEGEAPAQPPAQPAEDNQNLKPDSDKKSHRRSLSASAFKPVFSYVKSRGFYAGIQIDGTIVVERKDANAAFYGARVPVEKIIKGEVPAQGPNGMWPAAARGLFETLKGAEVGSLKVKDVKDPISSTTPAFGGSTADPSAPVASGGLGTEPASGSGPPAYVDDGVQRPGVGDVKYR